MTFEELKAKARLEAETAAKAANKPEAEVKAAGDTAEAAVVDPGTTGNAPVADPDKNKGAVILSSTQLKERLDRADKAARKAVMTDLETRAKAKGFASVEDMLEKLNAAAPVEEDTDEDPDDLDEDPTEPTAEEKQAAAEKKRRDKEKKDRLAARGTGKSDLEKRLEAIEARAGEAEKFAAKERRRNERLTQAMHAQEVETSLRELAIQAGVKDVDVAVHLFRRKVQTMSDVELEKLDEAKWFSDDLKKSRPYLFAEHVVDANTGTAPRVPGQQPAMKNGTFNALEATDKELQEYLRKNKIRLPT